MFRLDQKISLVTGAGSGIGSAIAETFAKAGAFVFVTDRDEKGGGDTAARIQAAGGKAEFLKLDVADEASCSAVAKTVLAHAGRLDILVNNAGIGHVGTLATTNGADLDRMYAVNVRGVFNVTKVFIDAMLARRSGNIINLASIGGVCAVSDRLAYCTTKFAVVGFTKCLALDHAKQGLRANAICPGTIQSPSLDGRIAAVAKTSGKSLKAVRTDFVGRQPEVVVMLPPRVDPEQECPPGRRSP